MVSLDQAFIEFEGIRSRLSALQAQYEASPDPSSCGDMVDEGFRLWLRIGQLIQAHPVLWQSSDEAQD